MKKYEAMRIRRISLKWSEEILANRAGIHTNYVKYYEEGKSIGRDYEYKIVNALYEGSKELDNIEHYRFRIMELAMKINIQDDKEILLKELAHIAVEANKFQMDVIDIDRFQRRENWDC